MASGSNGIVLAGAAGALGRALVPRLAAAGHEVRALDGGLAPAELGALLRGCDAVVDLEGPRKGARRRLVEAALACGVRRYLRQSSVAAYADGGEEWLDEEAATCGPAARAEAAVRSVEPRRLGWTILRGGPLAGGGGVEHALVERLRAGDAVVPGDGSNYVSPVNVDDLAAAVLAALELAPPGSTFNVVDEPLRYGDYVDALADLVGAPRPPRSAEAPLPPSCRCRNDAAQVVLGWTPRRRIWPYG